MPFASIIECNFGFQVGFTTHHFESAQSLRLCLYLLRDSRIYQQCCWHRLNFMEESN